MLEHPERLPERDQAIDAMLPNVPFDGWTKRALKAGVLAAGMPEDETDLLFPLGTIDMIETFSDLADRRMTEAAADLTETGLRARVKAIIALRLKQNRGNKEAIRRAMAILALPQNARAATEILARTVDAILHAAGDRSADMSWYTKRAMLAGIYSATVLFWLRDMSEEGEATLAFLDRRLAGIGRIGQARARLDGLVNRLPRPRLPRLPFPRLRPTL